MAYEQTPPPDAGATNALTAFALTNVTEVTALPSSVRHGPLASNKVLEVSDGAEDQVPPCGIGTCGPQNGSYLGKCGRLLGGAITVGWGDLNLCHLWLGRSCGWTRECRKHCRGSAPRPIAAGPIVSV